MPNRKERQDNRLPPKAESSEQSRARVRIGRACDRCKIKKSKCDGNVPCAGCVASDSTCEYSARRRREARDWYWGMHDVMDEALQRLYWACREGRGFPGVIPDESSGRVSTDAILRGLGLDPPAVERVGPIKSQSESVLDGINTLGQPSYRPPDVPPGLATRRPRESSDHGPLSPLGQNDMVDGVDILDERDGVDGADGASDSDEMGSMSQGMGDEHQTGGVPSVISQRFQTSPNVPLDPSILMGGNVAMVNLQSPVYSQMAPMGFQSTAALRGHTGQAQMQTTQQPQHAGMHFASRSQPGWTAERTAVEEPDTLPWPGNLAAVYKDTKPPHGGSGFHPPSHKR
ncbi:hypothetical protein PV08_04520 [Exophiala spinifera]|uniref:Zn(2)-C6 fungal-type domain-containing protein n=1 Tax=Exophiala spinifera TaxID=91928 RepID=A0A0D2BEA9_9EURO|nr:uncharacterized protein PV08_04520 [Exophiala spinifera]KIW17328.1 hypothetical protein PV08_04520 [Exophiala spinifera]